MGCVQSRESAELLPMQPRTASVTSPYSKQQHVVKSNSSVKVIPLEQLALGDTPSCQANHLSPIAPREPSHSTSDGKRSTEQSMGESEDEDDQEEDHSQRVNRKLKPQVSMRRVDDDRRSPTGPGALKKYPSLDMERGLSPQASLQNRSLAPTSFKKRFGSQLATPKGAEPGNGPNPFKSNQADQPGSLNGAGEEELTTVSSRGVSFHSSIAAPFHEGGGVTDPAPDPEEELLEAQHQARIQRKMSIQQCVRRMDDIVVDSLVREEDSLRSKLSNQPLVTNLSVQPLATRPSGQLLATKASDAVPANRSMKWHLGKSIQVLDGEGYTSGDPPQRSNLHEATKGKEAATRSLKHIVSFSAAKGVQEEASYTHTVSLPKNRLAESDEDRSSASSADSMIEDPYGQPPPPC